MCKKSLPVKQKHDINKRMKLSLYEKKKVGIREPLPIPTALHARAESYSAIMNMFATTNTLLLNRTHLPVKKVCPKKQAYITQKKGTKPLFWITYLSPLARMMRQIMHQQHYSPRKSN